jgi:hypothetical protein
VGLTGLVMLTVGPAALAVGAHAYAQWTEQQRKVAHPPLGTPVRDGAVTFVVHTLRCGQVAPDRAVHGRLCEATVGARNNGVEQVTIPGALQKLAGPEGTRHLPATDEPEPFGTIDPGEAATAILTYDLPTHATITHIELHGGPYTHGRLVALDAQLPLVTDR